MLDGLGEIFKSAAEFNGIGGQLFPIAGLFDGLEGMIKDAVTNYGTGVYAILFAVIFAETGLVVCPWLPGDSLLFLLGVLCHPSEGSLDFWILSSLLVAAAFIGDNVNYQIGKRFGERLFTKEDSRFFKRSHLEKTRKYFERYGGKTLVLARFVPIVRTFAPFVAGMGQMEFRRFLAYSFGGGLFWVYVCMSAGYFFGQIEFVRERFEVVILAVIALSVLPMVLKVRAAKREAATADEPSPS